MPFFRSLLFDVFYFLWAFPGSVVGYVLARLRLHGPLRVWCRIWCRGIALLERVVLGLNSTLTGRENIPDGPYILAAKHQSMWEAIKLPMWFRDCAIVLKAELLKLPFWGIAMDVYGAIPVERSRKADDLLRMLKAADAMAAAGRPIAIFPQGTRVAVGEKKPYHKGIALLYEHLNIPVVPMQVNSGLFWPRKAFIKKGGMVRAHLAPAIPPGLPRGEFLKRLEEVLETPPPQMKM